MRQPAFYLLPFVIYLVLLVIAGSIIVLSGQQITSDILNSLIALGGLLVALVTTLVGFWLRSDPQRQTLYAAQLKAYNDIYLVALLTVGSLIDITRDDISEDSLDRIEKLKSDFFDKTRVHWLLLPEKVRTLIISIGRGIENLSGTIRSDPKNTAALNLGLAQIGDISSQLFDSLRSSLGIEQLHKETVRLIGTTKEYEDSRSLLERLAQR